MYKNISVLAIAVLLLSCKQQENKAAILEPVETIETMQEKNTIHSYTAEKLEGGTYNFADLKGKKVLIVNTASKCGLTPQYEQLQEIYDTYGGVDFEIIGFPANDFMSQEPGSNEEIATFCKRNYGVTFPMMAKITVKGDNMHPIYKFLTSKEQNGVADSDVQWNFQKYLINEDGTLHDVIDPRTLPTDESIINWIKS